MKSGILRLILVIAGLSMFITTRAAAPASHPSLTVAYPTGLVVQFFDFEYDGYIDRVILFKPGGSIDSFTAKDTNRQDWEWLQEQYVKIVRELMKQNRSPGSLIPGFFV